jgi:hypothetical protein
MERRRMGNEMNWGRKRSSFEMDEFVSCDLSISPSMIMWVVVFIGK